MLFITFSSENSQLCHKIVTFWAAKATKIIKILYFLRMLASAKNLLNFNVLIKR